MKNTKLDDWLEEHVTKEEKVIIESSLDYQLGMMTSEYVIAVALPTLSTDMLKSRTVIEVDKDLTDQWKTMQDTYHYGDDKDNALFYSNLEWYKRNIEDKYLEDELVVRVPRISPGDLEEFAKGFEDNLWDCDLSHYSYVGLKQESGISWATKIILKREK